MDSNKKMRIKMFRLAAVLLPLLLTLVAGQESTTLTDDSNDGSNSSFVVATEPNFDNIELVSDLLDLFNLATLGRQWAEVSGQLTTECRADMSQYLTGLSMRKLWALKMNDASGHYSTGFLYGNNYFTGSLRLCESIFVKDQNKYEKRIRLSDITTINGNKGVVAAVKHENPPFMPTFFTVKLHFNETIISPTPRAIGVGVCLPYNCTKDDVAIMALNSESSINTRHLNLLEVKATQKEPYDFLSDPVFQVVAFVTAIVVLLLISGTTYDLVLNYRYQQKCKVKKYSKDLSSEASSGIGCTTYDLTHAGSEKKNSAIGISIPAGVNNNNSDENLAIERLSEQEEKLSVFEELILSFSLVANLRTIWDKSVGGDTISCIHGMRFISMLWIILGHTCIILAKYADNMEYRRYVEKIFIFQFVANGAYSVDTFFYISGFLVSFIYFRTNAKGKLEKLSKGLNEFSAGSLHFFGLLAYRFVRLTVPYMYMLGVVAVLMKYMVHESVFDMPANDHINCPNYWWRNLFYINTFFPVKDMCMLWSWYLANDTQFYIIGAIILIVAVKHFRLAAATVFVLLVLAWTTTTYIAFTNNHMPHTDDPFALFDKIYDKPWTRLGPYFIGMAVGWLLFKNNCQLKMTKRTCIIGWTVNTLVMMWLIFGLYNIEMSPLIAALYSSFSHSFWALCCAWITVACSSGYGGPVDKILSAPFIYPYSRVTYCAYLVHPMVIRYFTLTADVPMHLGPLTVIIFLGQAIISYVLAFILSLAFESPVVTALRILSPNQKHR